MAKQRQSVAVLSLPPQEDQQRFTDVGHVLARLNALNADFRQVEELSAHVKELVISLNQYREQLALTIAKADTSLRTQLANMDETKLQMEQAIASAESKSSELDTCIEAAKSIADYVSALGEMVSEDHEHKWAETQKLLEQRNGQLSQRLTDQVSTQVGEMQGANQAWSMQFQGAYQAWRKQVEAANQAWQLGQVERSEEWRASLSKDMTERTDAVTRQAHDAIEQGRKLAQTIEQVTQRQRESEERLTQEIAASAETWRVSTRAQEAELSILRNTIAFNRKLLYGGGVALTIVLVICLIALIH